MYSEKLGKLHFWLMFIGFQLTFIPMFRVGIQAVSYTHLTLPTSDLV